MQRTDPDVVSVVYSGDTEASKESIISKVKVSVAVWTYLQPTDAVVMVC